MQTYLEQYHDMIQKGEVIVGYWIRREIENLIEDLNDPAYIYDTTEAHKRIKFMETCCLQKRSVCKRKRASLRGCSFSLQR